MPVLDIAPTTFNILSDLIGLGTRLILLQGLILAYRWFLSIHVKNGNFIPVDNLATVPGDLFSGLRFAWALGPKSIAMIIIVVLLVLADFAHVFSDMDLRFQTVTVPGESLPVLDIERLNDEFSYKIVGDPRNIRTFDQNSIATFPIKKFISAIDSIADGFSPFVWTNPRQLYPMKDGGLVPYYMGYINGEYFFTLSDVPSSTSRRNPPLAHMRRFIPLNCTFDTMQTFEEGTLHTHDNPDLNPSNPEFVDAVNQAITPFIVESKVPDCDFSQPRASGVYQETDDDGVTVNEYAKFAIRNTETDLIQIEIGDKYVSEFYMPHGARRLARDRDDWRKGRSVTGITKIKMGNSLEIDLDDTTMAYAYSGESMIPEYEGNIPTNKAEYTFVSKVKGQCPDKPNDDPFPTAPRKPGFHEDCLLFFTANCDRFVEDVLNFDYNFLFPTSEDEPPSTACNFGDSKVEILWGENFNINPTTIAAVAGVFGRDGGQLGKMSFESRSFLTIHSIFAARFSLAMLSTKVSNKEVVKPQIGFVWTFFTVLPLIIGCFVALISCATRKSNRNIPENPQDLLVLGKEHPEMLPRRSSMTKPFPRRKDFHGVRYGRFRKEEGGGPNDTYIGLGGFAGVSADSSPQVEEAPNSPSTNSPSTGGAGTGTGTGPSAVTFPVPASPEAAVTSPTSPLQSTFVESAVEDPPTTYAGNFPVPSSPEAAVTSPTSPLQSTFVESAVEGPPTTSAGNFPVPSSPEAAATSPTSPLQSTLVEPGAERPVQYYSALPTAPEREYPEV